MNMNVDDLLNTGQLKSFEISGKGLKLQTKPAPVYHVTFTIIDKRLRQKKKASVIYELDVEVGKHELPAIWAEIMSKCKELEAKLQADSAVTGLVPPDSETSKDSSNSPTEATQERKES